eukprot:12349166-Prorocentrum_lima.AAC.1
MSRVARTPPFSIYTTCPPPPPVRCTHFPPCLSMPRPPIAPLHPPCGHVPHVLFYHCKHTVVPTAVCSTPTCTPPPALC